MATLQLGLDTFGDVTADFDGHALTQAQVIRAGVVAATGGADTPVEESRP